MAVYSQEQDNMVKWDGRSHSFYEVYFLKANLRPLSKAIWIRYTILAPKRGLGPPSASVWGMWFDEDNPPGNFALKETVAIEQTTIDRDIFYFQILEHAIYNNGMRGKLSSGGHEISWDLQYIPNESTFPLYPALFYHLPFPKTKFLSPNWSIGISGELKVDGKSYPLQNSPGQQAHLWGSSHAAKWAWGHCNTFKEDPGAVFEALSVQLNFGKKLSHPFTLFALKLGDGKIFKFHRVHQWFLNQSHNDQETWQLQGSGGFHQVKATFKRKLSQCLGVTYTDTDGSKLYCYHAEMADVEVELLESRKGKYQRILHLTSPQSGAFEVVERTPFSGMTLSL